MGFLILTHTHAHSEPGGIPQIALRPKQTWVVHICHYIPAGKRVNTKHHGKHTINGGRSTKGALNLAEERYEVRVMHKSLGDGGLAYKQTGQRLNYPQGDLTEEAPQ